MSRIDLKKVILRGVTTGLLVGNQLTAAPSQFSATPTINVTVPPTTTNMVPVGSTPSSVDIPKSPGTPVTPATPLLPGNTLATTSTDKEAKATTTTPSSNEELLKNMESADGGNFGYHLYSDEEMQLELSPDGLKLYNSLTPEGKKLARIVASSRCDGTNLCKGLNSCKSDKNDCAGKGQCKGQSKCAVASKDLAVKLVIDRLAQKRADVITPLKSPGK